MFISAGCMSMIGALGTSVNGALGDYICRRHKCDWCFRVSIDWEENDHFTWHVSDGKWLRPHARHGSCRVHPIHSLEPVKHLNLLWGHPWRMSAETWQKQIPFSFVCFCSHQAIPLSPVLDICRVNVTSANCWWCPLPYVPPSCASTTRSELVITLPAAMATATRERRHRTAATGWTLSLIHISEPTRPY